MPNIIEDYVSFETAKLLKKKGFNEDVNSYFISDNEIALISHRRDFNNHGIYLSAPTLQMAMKWLREVHNIHIGINPISGNGYSATIYDVTDFDDYGIISDTEFFFHVEETFEAAIKYCLENLI